MCIRDRYKYFPAIGDEPAEEASQRALHAFFAELYFQLYTPVSYTHLRAHETVLDLVCRLLLEKKKNKIKKNNTTYTIQNTQYTIHILTEIAQH